MYPTMYSKTSVIVMDHLKLNDFKKTTIIVISNITTIAINSIISRKTRQKFMIKKYLL